MSQKQNILKTFLIVVLCLVGLSVARHAKAVLLFDGSFRQTDARNGVHGAVGAYQESCIPKDDSFSVVAASTLHGNRPGYAGRFHWGVGSDYDCATNQHLFLVNENPKIPATARDVWYGYSLMYETDWKIAGGAAGWEDVGPTATSNYHNLATGGAGNTGIKLLTGTTEATKHHIYPMVVRTWPPAIVTDHPFGMWNDWMLHINWQTNNTGFVEVYYRASGQANYVKVYSRYGFQTEWNSWNSPLPGPNYYQHRVGGYRPSTSTNPQTFYIMDYKFGTAREDVEYNGGTPSVPVPVPVPIICGDNTDGYCPGGCTYLEDTDCPEPVPGCSLPGVDFINSTNPTAGAPVQFNDISSPGGASISKVGWNWNFGDGTSSTDQHPTNTFSSAGNFIVSISVLNSCGSTNLLSRNIIVASAPISCGNGVHDTGISEYCEKTTNQGCFGSSMCNFDCTACVAPPPICYGVICNTPGYCQKGLGRCIDAYGAPVCTYYYDTDPCEDNDGDPCKMGACSSSDGGRTGFCDKAKSDVACNNPGFCQAGRGQCVATSLTDYVCSYNDDPEPCDLDDNVCTFDVCKSTDGNFNSTCIATNLDACEGIVPCGRTIDNPKTNWDETAPCEFCHLILILNRVMNFLMELVAIVSLLAIIITGLLFITSAGNPEIKNKASLALKWIIIGLIIIFIAWLLIDFLLSAWGYLDPLGGKWNVIC
jgi:PKD repeat protein